jgi:hypothetical protein
VLPTITFLGDARYAIPNIALGGLKPGNALPDANGVIPGAGVALLVIAAWVAVSLGLGAWRTRVRDA